jgi:hypothetical protein
LVYNLACVLLSAKCKHNYTVECSSTQVLSFQIGSTILHLLGCMFCLIGCIGFNFLGYHLFCSKKIEFHLTFMNNDSKKKKGLCEVSVFLKVLEGPGARCCARFFHTIVINIYYFLHIIQMLFCAH